MRHSRRLQIISRSKRSRNLVSHYDPAAGWAGPKLTSPRRRVKARKATLSSTLVVKTRYPPTATAGKLKETPAAKCLSGETIVDRAMFEEDASLASRAKVHENLYARLALVDKSKHKDGLGSTEDTYWTQYKSWSNFT